VWQFLSDVLQEGGAVAALFFLLLIACGIGFRALWQQNQGLHLQMSALQEKRLEDALRMHDRMALHAEQIDQAMARLTSSLEVLITLSRRD
jgi:hypothetical protein